MKKESTWEYEACPQEGYQEIQELKPAGRLRTYFSYFVFYSVLGWLWETVITTLDEGTFQDRGFLHLPMCPIYGFAICLIVFLFYGKSYHLHTIFFGSAVITSIIEYVTSFWMEHIFHQVWWDYSHMKLQIAGRISMTGAVTFGLASILILRYIHPVLAQRVQSFIERRESRTICILGALLILMDTIVTSILLLKF